MEAHAIERMDGGPRAIERIDGGLRDREERGERANESKHTCRQPDTQTHDRDRRASTNEKEQKEGRTKTNARTK